MKDVQYAHLLHFFYYAKDNKVIAYGVSAIACPSENWIAAKFMCSREFFKVCVAFFNAIRKICRGLRVFKLKGDIFERIE